MTTESNEAADTVILPAFLTDAMSPAPDEEPPDELPAAELDSTAMPVAEPAVAANISVGAPPSDPLDEVTPIGDPGRQPEVVAVLGPLTVGVSDTELDFATVDPFEMRACSTRGLSHRHRGTPRQDAFCVASNDAWLALAVTDGVSEGDHSHVAAETAARAVCKLALDQATKGEVIDWGAICGRVSRRIVDEAKYRRLVEDCDGTDAQQVRAVRKVMSTTAVCAVISRQPDVDGSHIGWIAVLAGDSSAYSIRDGRVQLEAGGKADDSSDISSSSVHPLPGAASPIVFDLAMSAGQALVLVSDGLGDPLGAGDGEVGENLAKRWIGPPTIAQFFLDVNFYRKSFDDDRTALAIWVSSPEAQADC